MKLKSDLVFLIILVIMSSLIILFDNINRYKWGYVSEKEYIHLMTKVVMNPNDAASFNILKKELDNNDLFNRINAYIAITRIIKNRPHYYHNMESKIEEILASYSVNSSDKPEFYHILNIVKLNPGEQKFDTIKVLIQVVDDCYQNEDISRGVLEILLKEDSKLCLFKDQILQIDSELSSSSIVKADLKKLQEKVTGICK